jgi:hypothetical protein
VEFASKRFRCSEKLARLDRLVKIALLVLANVSCGSSKLDPRELVSGFDGLAIVSLLKT